MTPQNTRWLVVGVLAGALSALVATAAFFYAHRPPATETSASPPPLSVPGSATTPAGNSSMEVAVQLSPGEQAKIGVQTEEIRREAMAQDITAIGRVVEPETSLVTVSTRFGGRVARLFVNFPGQPVKKGDAVAIIAITGQPVGKEDPVSSIYSRDLTAAVEEYKFAVENREQAHSSSRPEAVAQADALLEASRIRLGRYGVTPDQVGTLGNKPEQPIEVTVNAEATGIVRTRKVTEGQFVNPGDTLVELMDLNTVWVKADVFDTDLTRIRPGLKATIQSETLPGVKLAGVVDFIDPESDPQTRTTSVRIQVDNPGTRLRPGMIVQTSFHLALGAMLTVSRNAVLDTGQDKFVYVARENGVFQKQRVQAGSLVGDRYPVLEGLTAGDKVVTNGVFLIDSQTRLTGGMTGLFGGSKSFDSTSQAQPPLPNNAYTIMFRIDPDPPQSAKQNTIHVSITDASGKPVSDAQVRTTLVMAAMPAMNMPEMRSDADLKWTGSDYTGPLQVLVSGGWNMAIEARRGNELLGTVQRHVNAR